MPTATKIVVHFDDGTTFEIPAAGTVYIFLNEPKARKCGHKPPYKKPPKPEDEAVSLLSADSTTTGTSAGATEAQVMEGSCYEINGVIVCP
jgi:hypothetical protein